MVESRRAFSGPGFLIVTVSSSSVLTESLEALRMLRTARRARDRDRGIGAVKMFSSSLVSGTTAAWIGTSDDAAATEKVLCVCCVSKDTTGVQCASWDPEAVEEAERLSWIFVQSFTPETLVHRPTIDGERR